ncbi:PIR protein [Plasmodium ovale]|uniref:PIR protein n=1 Tax=Plasmodium ovale TaxID=36330 RepID=A0A1D3JBL1_PLAOA|nr:PIR protein [Plasmodium ovale]
MGVLEIEDLLGKNVIKDLPSNKLYEDFNQNVTLSDYDKYCNKIFRESDGNEEVKKLYAMYARNFKIINDIQEEEYRITRCNHFMYWTYDKIRKMIRTKTNKDINILNHKNFIDIRNQISRETQKYFCQYTFQHDKLDDWREEKDLYDYFENFDYIKSKIDSDINKCKNYYKYVTYINELYKKHKEDEDYDCCSFWDDCNRYFKCEQKFNPTELLVELKCEDKISGKEAKESVESTTIEQATECPDSTSDSTNLQTCVNLAKGDETGKGLGQDNTGTLVSEDSVFHIVSVEQSVDQGLSNGLGIEMQVTNEGMSELLKKLPFGNDNISTHQYQYEYPEALPENNNQTSSVLEELNGLYNSHSFRISLVCLLIVITILMFSHHYGFFPFKYWLRKKGRRKKKYYNHEGLIHNFSFDDPEPVYINSRSVRLNIVYNPRQNSFQKYHMEC